ncbi:unnamed protein product [Larinioides sclopetarius]|uniref:Uncharacterized protein n=1 Tax=Larinioides sclopetarius TaxID=280406 RepID=A0AAV2A5Z8_9ARAC
MAGDFITQLSKMASEFQKRSYGRRFYHSTQQNGERIPKTILWQEILSLNSAKWRANSKNDPMAGDFITQQNGEFSYNDLQQKISFYEIRCRSGVRASEFQKRYSVGEFSDDVFRIALCAFLYTIGKSRSKTVCSRRVPCATN